MTFNQNHKHNAAELTAKDFRAQVAGNRHQETRGKHTNRRR